MIENISTPSLPTETNPSGHNISLDDQVLLLDIQIAICSLSIVGSLMIIFFYRYLNQKKKSFTFVIIFNIALTDLLLWGVRLAESIHGRVRGHTLDEFAGMCELFGYLQIALALSNFCWVSLMSFCIYKTIVFRVESFEHLQSRFYVVSYGAPIMISFIPLASQSYGETDAIKCWIRGSSEEVGNSVVRWLVFYLPLILTIIYSFWVISKVWNVLKESIPTNVTNRESMKRRKLITRIRNQLMFYPLALVVCYFFPLIHRIVSTINATSGDRLWILVLHYLSEPLQGFGNAIVYGTSNRDVRHNLKKLVCCRFWRKKKPKVNAEERLLDQNAQNMSLENVPSFCETEKEESTNRGEDYENIL